ncbi:MAG TPA: quinolinate phosphoribosyl transferase [Spirochaetota bacterium]|nr:quinolinate phosphoribosyl transferase [Spirochaetota bacterium]HPJ37774.1 quinolinate phosphoribosyl transferase [Spirochaetota bacterium]HPQ52170.1 quinolinate phosphoribosyl transferase [Spirochaetota bacterium]
MKKRLESHLFDLPVQELRRGYLSDIYFWREKVVLEQHNLHPDVTMQVFQKKDAILCGIDEAIAVLKLASGRYTSYEKAFKLFDQLIELKRTARSRFLQDKDAYLGTLREKLDIARELDELWEDGFQDLTIDALHDGDSISPWETVMHIHGDASLFAHLETIYLGILARRTKIATNVRNVVEAANGHVVLYFPARFDHWAVQGGDGYAAHIGGAHGVSTDAQAEWWGAKGSGTVPHALIAACGGDTVQAVRLFGESYPETNLVALVDFDNDCIGTALDCSRAMGDKLWGVRLDTSENMVDRSVVPIMSNFKPTGVVPELVCMMRKALDREGYQHVKIIVSGGFNPERIAAFEKLQVPVDAYGVGSCLMQGTFDYTADIVRVHGKDMAKAGRKYRPNPRLSGVHY